ncbi:MAG: DUF3365 domain-containing protein [Rhodospirillales bacterium]|nr:DUF3365 domain-containing protein [Rhodospirillales bacterium]
MIWSLLDLARVVGAAGLALLLSFGAIADDAAGSAADQEIAADLAELYRAARTVISNNQSRINDPAIGDKGLSGEKVLADTVAIFSERHGWDPRDIDGETRRGALLQAQMDAIVQVMDEHQDTINQKGIGFKGFIPAVFGRLVNERFNSLAANDAAMKSTAPRYLVRNRKALPDAWEEQIINDKLASADWPVGKTFAAVADIGGRDAVRVLVPEYYSQSCLACHGEPKGEMDVTGYPKEGAHEGDLGGVLSVTLYR